MGFARAGGTDGDEQLKRMVASRDEQLAQMRAKQLETEAETMERVRDLEAQLREASMRANEAETRTNEVPGAAGAALDANRRAQELLDRAVRAESELSALREQMKAAPASGSAEQDQRIQQLEMSLHAVEAERDRIAGERRTFEDRAREAEARAEQAGGSGAETDERVRLAEAQAEERVRDAQAHADQRVREVEAQIEELRATITVQGRATMLRAMSSVPPGRGQDRADRLRTARCATRRRAPRNCRRLPRTTSEGDMPPVRSSVRSWRRPRSPSRSRSGRRHEAESIAEEATTALASADATIASMRDERDRFLGDVESDQWGRPRRDSVQAEARVTELERALVESRDRATDAGRERDDAVARAAGLESQLDEASAKALEADARSQSLEERIQGMAKDATSAAEGLKERLGELEIRAGEAESGTPT